MSTKYNWDEFPEWANYAAIDANDELYAFFSKPEIYQQVWLALDFFTYIKNCGGENNDWKNSLEQRPIQNMSTKYNWENIPPRINYIAIDQNSQKHGYINKPMTCTKLKCWLPPLEEESTFLGYEKCDDWLDSLEEHPNRLDGIRTQIGSIIKNVLQDEDTRCGNEILCSVIAERCAAKILKALNI